MEQELCEFCGGLLRNDGFCSVCDKDWEGLTIEDRCKKRPSREVSLDFIPRDKAKQKRGKSLRNFPMGGYWYTKRSTP